jgi:hypothetical protein
MKTIEKRKSERRAITHTVRMATGLGPPLECRMKDVSEYGACIKVSDPQSSPQKFLVMLEKDLMRWCEVMWRSEDEIGIKFVPTPQSLKANQTKSVAPKQVSKSKPL